MYVCVFLHVRLLMEPLPAVLTRVRPRVRVDEEMRRQRRRPFERLSALLTLEKKIHNTNTISLFLFREVMW